MLESVNDRLPVFYLDVIKKFVYNFIIFQGGEPNAHHQIKRGSSQRL